MVLRVCAHPGESENVVPMQMRDVDVPYLPRIYTGAVQELRPGAVRRRSESSKQGVEKRERIQDGRLNFNKGGCNAGSEKAASRFSRETTWFCVPSPQSKRYADPANRTTIADDPLSFCAVSS